MLRNSRAEFAHQRAQERERGVGDFAQSAGVSPSRLPRPWGVSTLILHREPVAPEFPDLLRERRGASFAVSARKGTTPMASSLYAILGVAKDASEDAMRQAYRKQARKLHPDVNPGDADAEQRFKELSAAYEVLSDPEKRKLYDEFGEDAARAGFDPEKARAYKRWQGQAAHEFGGARTFADEVDLGELFGGILGRRRRGFPREEARPRRGSDIEAELTIELGEAARGTTRGFRLVRPERCEACLGKGTSGAPRTCPACQGSGGSGVSQGPLKFRAPCGACGGSGQRPAPPCVTCSGGGAVEQTVTIDVKIPAGIEDGQKLRLAGQGATGRAGGPPGDLLVVVRIAPHPLFRREGQDLHLELPVTVAEAMLGARVDVPTIEGEVGLKIPARSNSGRKLRLRGKGLPGRSGGPAGNLYVTLQVRVPDLDTDDVTAREAAKALDALYDHDVRASLKGRV